MFLKKRFFCALIQFLFLFVSQAIYAQSELEPWGNVTGIRRHGQLFEFETSIAVLSKDSSHSVSTAKEKQRPLYSRDGSVQVVKTNIDSLHIRETVTDKGAGRININLLLNSHADTIPGGIFFCLKLPVAAYGNGRPHLINAYADSLNTLLSSGVNATGFDLRSATCQFKITFGEALAVTFKKDTATKDLLVYLWLASGGLPNGDSLQRNFTIKVAGNIDRSPVGIAIDTTKPGRPFDGLGGNFRLQNPKYDPQVINYCLDNLRVAWGRVEMPWRFWQPNEVRDTSDTVKLHPAVVKAMEMAQRLNKMGIPLILSAWFPPNWAVTGKVNFRPVNGVWGNPLDPAKMPEIYKSITDYILYLQQHYGIAINLFSFNESDLGINIRLTAEQHDELIKGLGAYFLAHGLKTKMLLGDNSDATSYKFIYPAMNDPAAQPYIGAISFHSWRGWDDKTLQKWADAATQIKVPLIVGEGSIDAQAWGYPQVFQEPSYALQEINLYTRLLAICQPLSILQWQLTTDYSPLIGGGIFGNKEPLHPGQRFWNLKQLASTPAHLYAMPVKCDNNNMTCAALGDNDKGIYALHLVNNGATRQVTLTGLPASLKVARLYVTNKKLSMKEENLEVKGSEIIFKAKATSYYTLVCSLH
jgi:hypothetical protein